MSNTSYNGDEIAVIGLALRVPGANDVQSFWDNLSKGRECFKHYSDQELIDSGVSARDLNDPNYVKVGAEMSDVKAFDAAFFGMSALDASFMDPQHRHFLELCWEAFEHSGEVPSAYPGAISVYAGSGQNTYLFHNLITNPELVANPGLWYLRHIGNDKDFLASRASFEFDLKGASINIQTACSTFLVAAHSATQALLNRECDMALAGGVSIIVPESRGYLYQEGGIQDPTGHCRAFDVNSKGTVFGSGGTVVVLKRLEDAIADHNTIHGIIRSSAVNNDGAMKAGFTAPSVDGQVAAIVEALDLAEIDPSSIGYMEAHGTGTPIGDPIEVAALTQAWRQSTQEIGYCALSSVKTNVGHLDSAAGGAGFIKLLGALSQQQKYPTVHFTAPNPALDLEQSPFYVSNQCEVWTDPVRRAAISAFGVGGTNAHLILESYDQPPSPTYNGDVWLCLSAKTASALARARERLADYLVDHKPSLADVSYTLSVGREKFDYRCALKASSLDEAIHKLRGAKVAESYGQEQAPERITFVFTGQGSQYLRMAEGLYQQHTVFKQAFDQCSEILLPTLDLDIRSLVFGDDPDQRIDQTAVAQPLLFSLEYALVKAWESEGVTFNECIGHSIGEYVCATLCGVFTLEAALTLVAKRGALMQSLPEGSMLAVSLSEANIQTYLKPDISLAAINAEQLCVLSGPIDAINALAEQLSAKDIAHKPLVTSHAFHSLMMEPILEEFEQAVQVASPKPPSKRFISNVSGDWILPEQAVSPSYWSQHLRGTVNFYKGISTLIASAASQIFVEVGPGNGLTKLINQHPGRGRRHSAIASLPGPKDTLCSWDYFRLGKGRLWCEGFDISLALSSGRKIPLPTYAWDHKEYWVKPGQSTIQHQAPGLIKQPFDQWFYQENWQSTPLCPPSETTDSILILANENCSGSLLELVETLAANGARCVLAKKSIQNKILDGQNYQYNAFNESGVEWLMQKIPAPTIIIDYHYFDEQPVFNETAIEQWQHDCFDPVFYLTKFLATADVSLTCVNLIESFYEHHPALAFIDRALATLSAETKKIKTRTIERILFAKESPVAARQSLAYIVDDILSAHEPRVRYQLSQRLCLSYQHQKMDNQRIHFRLRNDGVYLITGSRGVSIDLARYLLEKYDAQVILLSRNELSEPSLWTKEAALNSRYQQLVTLLPYIDRLHIITGDITAANTLPTVIEQMAPKRLNGIFHTAGVLDDALLANKSLASAYQVLAPKVQALAHFEPLLLDDALDFLLLFSSVSSILPVAGQIDYSIANGFISNYAHIQNRYYGRPVTAINWGSWAKSGMAVDAAKALGLIETEREIDGCGVFQLHRTIGSNHYWLGKLSTDVHWLLDQHRTRQGLALMPATGYIDQVVSAYRAQTGIQKIEICDLLFMAAFTVADHQERVFAIHFNEDEFVICSAHSLTAAKNGQFSQEHVRGSIGPTQHIPQKVNIGDLAQQCSQSLIDRRGQAEHRHLVFGDRWRCVDKTLMGINQSLTYLHLDDQYLAECKQYPLHPAMMDMAIGNVHLITGFDENRDFYVPLSYGRLEIYGVLSQEIISHTIYKGMAQPNTAAFDIMLMTTEGEVIVQITDFMMKKVAFDALDQLEAASSIEEVVTPQESPASVLELSIRHGINPEEGCQAIETILNGHLPAQTVVCPLELEAYEQALLDLDDDNEPDLSNALERPNLTTEYQPPSNDTEESISRLWSEALGIAPIGIDDNFFELGGHSLLLTQVVARVKKQLKATIAIGEFFEFSTIREWSTLISDQSQTIPTLPLVEPVDRTMYQRKLSELECVHG